MIALVMGQGGASHNREICAWRVSPSFSHGIKSQVQLFESWNTLLSLFACINLWDLVG